MIYYLGTYDEIGITQIVQLCIKQTWLSYESQTSKQLLEFR